MSRLLRWGKDAAIETLSFCDRSTYVAASAQRTRPLLELDQNQIDSGARTLHVDQPAAVWRDIQGVYLACYRLGRDLHGPSPRVIEEGAVPRNV